MGILWEHSFGVFLLLQVVLGGGAAWMAGRAVARTWKPLRVLVAYAFLLACAVRFLDYALFEGSLLSIHYWIVAFALTLIFALGGWRVTRTRQMVTQYRWLYERTGPFTWRDKVGRDEVASGS